MTAARWRRVRSARPMSVRRRTSCRCSGTSSRGRSAGGAAAIGAGRGAAGACRTRLRGGRLRDGSLRSGGGRLRQPSRLARATSDAARRSRSGCGWPIALAAPPRGSAGCTSCRRADERCWHWPHRVGPGAWAALALAAPPAPGPRARLPAAPPAPGPWARPPAALGAPCAPTTPVPVNWPACAVAATLGAPWFTEAKFSRTVLGGLLDAGSASRSARCGAGSSRPFPPHWDARQFRRRRR